MDEVVSVEKRIQELCKQILTEQEPAKVEELFANLRGLVHASQQDTRLRLSYIVKRYRKHIRPVESVAAEPASESTLRIRQLLTFLGLAQDPQASKPAA